MRLVFKAKMVKIEKKLKDFSIPLKDSKMYAWELCKSATYLAKRKWNFVIAGW